jgi:VWFA-related protein
MKMRSLLALLLVLNLFTESLTQKLAPAAPQQSASPAPKQQISPVDEDEVVRITTNLVQVDAVVTDKSGKQITNLLPEDFEILEDGRPQKITNFSYVASGAASASPPVAATPIFKNNPPRPPTRLRPEDVRRTIALVVDDLGLSFESTYFVRRALKKIVNEQVQPGDLVAIIRTSAGIGALQQFTADKRQLYAAIERVRWYPSGRGGISAFAPIESDPFSQYRSRTSNSRNPAATDATSSNAESLDEFREELFAVGTLGALNFVLRGLRELPGRKSVVLLSDSLPIFNSEGRSDRILDALRRLTDLANRASVVIYTLDARGLQTLGLTAADDTSGLTPAQVESSLNDRRAQFFESQNGLNYLAQQTGGFFIRNTNDISGGVKRVLDDQKGYYLIGYRPDEATFDPKTGRPRFHKWTINVKNHPDLKVRFRRGFYGIKDEDARPARRTPGEQLMAALSSPFGAGGVGLQLTSLFINDPRTGSYVRSLLHVNARDLSFKDEAEDWHKSAFNVLAITFGDNGRVIDQVSRSYTLRVRGDQYKRALQGGFVYQLAVPVKKPGAYQLRAALRDETSERVGAASQFIEVPDISKNRLALSGIVLSGEAVTSSAAEPSSSNAAASIHASATSSTTSQTSSASNAVNDENAQAGPAVRKFRAAMKMDYLYYIYNAQLDNATHRPQLTTQVILLRDGQPVFTGQPRSFDAAGQTDLKRLVSGGRLQLGVNMKPGEYVLQIIVTDALAKEKYRMATQYIDFEIVG